MPTACGMSASGLVAEVEERFVLPFFRRLWELLCTQLREEAAGPWLSIVPQLWKQLREVGTSEG